MHRRLSFAFLLLACLLGACGTPEPPPPRKALIGIVPIEAAIRDETMLDQRADCLASAAAPWFAVDEGDVPIHVTAPHATRPFREGA